MATKEITKRQAEYPEPVLEPELISEAGDRPRNRGQVVAMIALLWDRRQFLFRRAAIAFVASSILALIIPVRYTSTTRLMPPDQAGQGMASMLAAVSKASGDIGGIGGMLGLKTSGDLFVGVLQSRTVADDVINRFDLRKEYGVAGSGKAGKGYEVARKQLELMTEISSDRKSGIITLKVSDKSPDRAAAMAREYVEALNNIVITLNTSSAHKERVFLEERLVQVQLELEQAEKDFGQFASKNTTLDVKDQGRAMITAAAQLEGQLIATQTELEGLRQIYTENNVRVRSVQARIDELRRQLQKLGRKPVDGPNESSNKDDAGGQASDPYPTLRQLPLLGVEWADLYRRSQVEEAIFETLTKQYELAKVEEVRETPSVKVLDPADVPERKSYPPRTLLVAMCTGIAFVLSGAWLLARARWKEIDPTHPGKMLAQEIFQNVRTSVSRMANRVLRRSSDTDESSSDGS
jgi:capsule polysaccharide export protein KpsE/RkpR